MVIIQDVSLPYYGWRLTASKPKPGYPNELKHLGDHIRKRRIDLGLNRKELARHLRTNAWTIKHWEEHLKSRIGIRFYHTIFAFLGYNPLPDPKTPGEEIRRQRLTRGLSKRSLAGLTKTDEGTVARLESDTRGMARRSREKVIAYFDATCERELLPNHACSSKHRKAT